MDIETGVCSEPHALYREIIRDHKPTHLDNTKKTDGAVNSELSASTRLPSWRLNAPDGRPWPVIEKMSARMKKPLARSGQTRQNDSASPRRLAGSSSHYLDCPLPLWGQAASVQMPCRARLTTVLRASGRSLFRRMLADLSSAFQR